MNRKPLHLLGYAIFFLGVSAGLALATVTIWNRIEAINYFFRGAKYDPFNGLRCPVLIAPAEMGTVSAVFDNPTSQEDTFFYRAEISGRPSTRRMTDQITVSPRQAKSISFTVDTNDVDLLFFIFAKINISPNSVHPAQEAVCGILVVNLLGLSGVQIAAIAIVFSLLGMAIGLGLWQQTSTRTDGNGQRVIQALGLVVLLAMLAGALGWWMVGVILLALSLLLLVISLRFAIG